MGQKIETRRADAMNPPVLLPHGQHPLSRRFGRGEVDVAELGQRIAHRIVDGPFADVAALNVGDRYSQRQRNGGRRQILVAICNQQQQIRS